jgi:hypothetical protein
MEAAGVEVVMVVVLCMEVLEGALMVLLEGSLVIMLLVAVALTAVHREQEILEADMVVEMEEVHTMTQTALLEECREVEEEEPLMRPVH